MKVLDAVDDVVVAVAHGRVRMPFRSEPAAGFGHRDRRPTHSPLAIRGSQRCFCASRAVVAAM